MEGATSQDLGRAELRNALVSLLRFAEPLSGRLRFLNGRILENRTIPTSEELKESFLVLPIPVQQATYIPQISTNANDEVDGVSDGSSCASIDSLILEQPWATICILVPKHDQPLYNLFSSIASFLHSPDYPLPVFKTSTSNSATGGHNEYLCTVLPKPFAEVLADCAIDSSLTILDSPVQVHFTEIFQRKIAPPEFALSLPANLSTMFPPQVCREISHLLAYLLVPGRKDLPQQRFIQPPQRARSNWNRPLRNSREQEYWGGAATIALSSAANLALNDALPHDPRYDGISGVSRIIDLMSGTRIDPETPTSKEDWVVYQARWGFFFPGYWTGLDLGFQILMQYGAVISGIFMENPPAGRSYSKAYEVSTSPAGIERKSISIGPEHSALAAYLDDQRDWMGAYEMAPRAPQSGELKTLIAQLGLADSGR